MLTIGSSDTLIIRTQMPNSGEVYTLEMQQKTMSPAGIQRLVDSIQTDKTEGNIVSLWRIECHDISGVPMFVEDITDQFDTRTIEEIEEASKRARIEADHVPHYAGRLQRSHGTINHAQQGIAR